MRFYELNLKTKEQLCTLTELADEMYLTLKDILRRNGGFVDMVEDECDCAYAVECSTESAGLMFQTQITGLKLENDIVMYRTELNGYQDWRNLMYSENYYLPTLFSLMENIWNYLPMVNDRD